MTLLVILAVVIGWHLIFPFLGAIAVFSAAAWGALMVSVVALCIAIMLVFIFAGMSIFMVGIGAFVWVMLAVILFPVIFPIVAPLFIILLFISYRRRQQK